MPGKVSTLRVASLCAEVKNQLWGAGMKKDRLHPHAIFLLVFPVAFLLTTCLFFAVANAGEVTLAWDANTEENLAGYKLYYDGDSDAEMYQGTGATEGDSPIIIYVEDLADVDAPTFTLTGLEEGQYYYFALTAFDSDGLESDFSEEVGALIGSEESSDTSTSVSTSAVADSGNSDGGGGGGSGCFISGTMGANSIAGTDILMIIIFAAMVGMGCRKRK